MKTLVACFSASGSTAKLAKTLAAAAEGELYEIRPAVPYEKRDLNWMDKKARSTVEMQDKNCRPALADTDAPVAGAEVVFLGFPIWWYREPSIIDSFLEAYDFSGKTVVPFFTSGGSQLGEGQARRNRAEKQRESVFGTPAAFLLPALPGLQLTPQKNLQAGDLFCLSLPVR